MFQINTELFDIANNYQNFINKAHLEGKEKFLTIVSFALLFHIFITPIIIAMIKWYKYRKQKNKEHKTTEDAYDEQSHEWYFLILLALFATGLTLSLIIIPNTQRKAFAEAIEQYKTEHPDLKTLNEYSEDWVREFAKEGVSNETTLTKSKGFSAIFLRRLRTQAPSVKYYQLKPAPEGDAPMIETKITTKSEVYTNKPDAKEKLSPNHVQLIKIEEKDGLTILTAHLKADDVWLKVQIQENILDAMIEGYTKFYYNQKENKLVIGV